VKEWRDAVSWSRHQDLPTMDTNQPLRYSRREFGTIVLAGVPLSLAMAASVNSTFGGVQIGAITYSFRYMASLDDVIKAMVQIGLGEVELMSNHAESFLGAPIPPPRVPGAGGPGGPGGAPPAPGAGRPPMTPEQRAATQARAEELRKWRLSTSPEKFKEVRKKFDDAGIALRLLCFNMTQSITDDEIDYAFQMAKALGVKAISSTTQLTVAKRVAPFADKHKIMVGYHGHSNLTDPNEFATPESFATAMSYSKFHGINLDIGHFTAANFDPVAYIKEHHGQITNIHLKDRKKDQGANVPWGQGDTPIKDVLLLMKQNKWDIPANIEYEYPGDPLVEVPKCLEFCRQTLA
jgi:sugar phosphate isomerase/epimerase